LVDPTNPKAALRAVPMSPSVMHLKCPSCGEEGLFIGVPQFDVAVSCDACGQHSEVRQAHEAWCLQRREVLANRFPNLRDEEEPPAS
jgi:ribosomal protein S27E